MFAHVHIGKTFMWHHRQRIVDSIDVDLAVGQGAIRFTVVFVTGSKARSAT